MFETVSRDYLKGFFLLTIIRADAPIRFKPKKNIAPSINAFYNGALGPIHDFATIPNPHSPSLGR